MRLTQRTFCRMFFYQLLGNKEPIDQVASWLFTVARNKIIDSKRKKQPLATDFLFANAEDAEMGEWMDILMDDSSNPETVYLRNLVQETLKEALERITRRTKTGICPERTRWHSI